jgi:hypothetical protein
MARCGVNLPRGLLTYRHLSLSSSLSGNHKSLKEDLETTSPTVGLSAALTLTVIRIQPSPFPDEYPRGHAMVLTGGGQRSKMSMGVQLASCGRISQSSASELKIERSVGVSIQLKIESVTEMLS